VPLGLVENGYCLREPYSVRPGDYEFRSTRLGCAFHLSTLLCLATEATEDWNTRFSKCSLENWWNYGYCCDWYDWVVIRDLSWYRDLLYSLRFCFSGWNRDQVPCRLRWVLWEPPTPYRVPIRLILLTDRWTALRPRGRSQGRQSTARASAHAHAYASTSFSSVIYCLTS